MRETYVPQEWWLGRPGTAVAGHEVELQANKGRVSQAKYC